MPDVLFPTFAERLETLRLKAGKTKEQLAADSGVGQRNYMRYSLGTSMPQVRHLDNLCKALDVERDELLGLVSVAVVAGVNERLARIEYALGIYPPEAEKLPPVNLSAPIEALARELSQALADAHHAPCEPAGGSGESVSPEGPPLPLRPTQ